MRNILIGLVYCAIACVIGLVVNKFVPDSFDLVMLITILTCLFLLSMVFTGSLRKGYNTIQSWKQAIRLNKLLRPDK